MARYGTLRQAVGVRRVYGDADEIIAFSFDAGARVKILGYSRDGSRVLIRPDGLPVEEESLEVFADAVTEDESG